MTTSGVIPKRSPKSLGKCGNVSGVRKAGTYYSSRLTAAYHGSGNLAFLHRNLPLKSRYGRRSVSQINGISREMEGKVLKKKGRGEGDKMGKKSKGQKKGKKSEIREQDKIHKKDKKEKKIKDRRKKKKNDLRSALIRSGDADVEDEKPDSESPSAFLHGLSALRLLGKEDVRGMEAANRHEYLSQVSKLCERLLGLMYSVLVCTDDRAANEFPSFQNQVTDDMIRLRHLPIARQCVEMTLWHHVARFNTDCASRVKSIGYGAAIPKKETAKPGLMNHDEDVNGEVFNSFKNRYMNNILDTYQEDLEKIRQNEGLDEEHVHFLRRCLDAGADLFAHIKAWDQNHPPSSYGRFDKQNKSTKQSGN